MGNLKFEVPHSLSAADARARIEALVRHWGQKYGLQARWNGDVASVSGKVMGVNLDATVQVAEQVVRGEASDPGLLLRGQARKYLEEKLRTFLDAKRSLADLGLE